VATPTPDRRLRVHPVTVIVLVAVLAVTVLASVLTRSSHQDTEDRLLAQRVEAGAAIFSSALPGLFAPLMGAAALAEETGAEPAAMRRYLRPQVGEDATYDSISVWEVDGTGPLMVEGDTPQFADLPAAEREEHLRRAAATADVVVVDLVGGETPSLGYAATVAPPGVHYVVYAEDALPENRTQLEQEGSPFRDLDYALYLGDRAERDQLLVASKPDLPLEGRTDQTVLPFGDQQLLLVLHPKGDLAGELSARLPWLILVAGVVLALSLAGLVEALRRRRDAAMALAEEQRTVAHVVQQSLLPSNLPDVAEVDIEVRYRPGVEGTEVGGDWYDVLQLGPDRLLVVVGDVAGRGLKAATVMAALRHAIRAYALQGDDPTVLPGKLTPMVELEAGGFATVLFLDLDTADRKVRVVSAGHPPPLLVGGDRRFVEVPVGPPVGVGDPTRVHDAVELRVDPGDALLAFTDGLFERRGEAIDDGLDRLLETVAPDQPLADVLDHLVEDLAGTSGTDDLAIVGIRW
jgi:serine phosphatase RsbU (regulator of sigma subunit)